MTEPTKPAQHTDGASAPAAEDPILGRAVDAALDDARARMEAPPAAAPGGDGPTMVLGEVQADLAQADVATAPTTIDDLDASLAQAAAEATAKLLQEADAPLPPVEPSPAPQAEAPPPAAAAPEIPAQDPEPVPAGVTIAPPEPPAAPPQAEAQAAPAPAAPEPVAVAAPAASSARPMLASVLDPLAERAERLPQSVRHMIGWIAVVTLLNAAAIWTVVLWSSARSAPPEATDSAATSLQAADAASGER